MTERRRLPNRRRCETQRIETNGLAYTFSIGRFPDDSIAEIFLNNHLAGSAADIAARDSAIILSIALQYGVPLETMRRALSRDSHGVAQGPLGRALDAAME